MKTAALFVALIGSAAAFAPAQQTLRSATSLAAFEGEIGAQAPLGFWDPLGFCDDGDKANFEKLRTAEIKHGRIAMMAIVGHITTAAGVRLPGCEKYPAGLAALTKVDPIILVQVIGTMSVLEFLVRDQKGLGEYPGDYRNGLFKWDASAEEQREKRSIELNNGRAAQMGILALMVHEKLTGEPYVLNAFLGYPTHFNEGF